MEPALMLSPRDGTVPSHELSPVLRPITEGLVDLAGVSTAAVWLRTSADRCPRCRTARSARDLRLHIGATAGPFDAHDCAHALSNQWEFVRSALDRRQPFLLGGATAVFPLLAHEELLGVLAVLYRRPIESPEFGYLGLIANHTASAIDQAQRTARPILRVEKHASNEIIGQSPAIRSVLDTIHQVAASDTTVLLIGETGTGKELIARELHAQSARAGRPMVTVNCGAIAPGLIESELFGHERGAFTGAVQRRVGRFEAADRSTLFLDEVSELPLDGQVKLLRALQEQEVERVGGSRPIRVDVRLVAATNRDLERDVADGRVRPDLFYRLNVLPIHIPPLRDRREDIPRLARHFIAHFERKLGKHLTGIDPESLRRLQTHSWPGNVRELRNVIERACVLARGPLISIDRPLAAVTPADDDAERFTSLADHERSYLRRVLVHTKGRISGPRGAAAILDLHPNTLRSRLDRLGLTGP
jgi:formate hydrogenlyase transcriptional activator